MGTRLLHIVYAAVICGVLSAPALANEKRKESCAITAGIVSQAVFARMAGQTPDEAKAALRADGSGITGIYKATIPPLVDMVYGFEKSTLGQGVVDEYEAQCLSF
ncbi:MAG: hypothetical protein AAGL23_14340 [Pseudomonadota bacterium]